jgi:hypothetical protein
MSGENELLTLEKDLIGGEAGAVVPITGDEQLIALENMAKNADRMIAAKQKIWAACIKITKADDWTVFGSQGKQKAELGHAGAFRYASFLGISFNNWTSEKVSGTDEKGQWYRWDFECDAVFSGRIIRVYGRAGSRDKFFGKDHGAFKELHDVNEGDIKQAGRRNAMKEGVKVLMGLHHMDPKELEAAGLKMGSASGYEFKGDEAKKADASEVQSVVGKVEKVGQRLVKTKNGEKPVYSIHMAEGDKYDTWSDTDAKVAKASIEDKKNVKIEYVTNQYGNSVKTLVTVEA